MSFNNSVQYYVPVVSIRHVESRSFKYTSRNSDIGNNIADSMIVPVKKSPRKSIINSCCWICNEHWTTCNNNYNRIESSV